MLQSIIWLSFMTNPLISHCIVISPTSPPFITRSETDNCLLHIPGPSDSSDSLLDVTRTPHIKRETRQEDADQQPVGDGQHSSRTEVLRVIGARDAPAIRSGNEISWNLRGSPRLVDLQTGEKRIKMSLFGRKYISDISRISTVTLPTPLWAAKRSLRCPTGTFS